MFPKNKKQWQVDNEVSIGNGNYAKGKLAYQKTKKLKKGQVQVKVSGTLTKDSFNHPGTPLIMKDARYIVSGQQTYDLRKKEWVAGNVTFKISYKMEANALPIGDASGTMHVALKMQSKK